MKIFSWIDKNIKDIEETPLFRRYFNGITLEKMSPFYFLNNEDAGFSLMLNKNLKVNTIVIFSHATIESIQYCDHLADEIHFTLSRDEVQTRLGKPYQVQGGNKTLLYGKTALRDRYIFSNHYVQFEYNKECSAINLIMIGSLS